MTPRMTPCSRIQNAVENGKTNTNWDWTSLYSSKEPRALNTSQAQRKLESIILT